MSKQAMPVTPDAGRASKSFRPVLALVLLVCITVCGDAWSGPRGHGHGHGWHGRSHVGISIGAPLWVGHGPRWYGDPFYDYYYYYPRPVMVLRPAPVSIERGGEPSARLWYFCADPQGYYPYVHTCAGGWRSVLPSAVIR